MTYCYDFPMAGNTATMVLYRAETDEILLGLRRKDSDAFPDRWSLPGGYLNVGTESVRQAATRETLEETGLGIAIGRWILFFDDDKIGVDPRYIQVVNLCYYVNVTEDEYNNADAFSDLQEVEWVKFGKVLETDLPFNHNEIVREFQKTFL